MQHWDRKLIEERLEHLEFGNQQLDRFDGKRAHLSTVSCWELIDCQCSPCRDRSKPSSCCFHCCWEDCCYVCFTVGS